MKAWHVGICVGFMAIGVVLVVAGAGAFAAVIAPLGCVAMMAMMVWMMVSPQLRKRVRGLASGLRPHHGPGTGH